MQKERCYFKNKLQRIINIKFQVLFWSVSPFPYGTFSLSIINIL